MAINLTDPIFTDESKARAHLEEIRWPNGAICTHCCSVDKVYRLEGKSHRPGLFHCNNCDGAFTVTTGSVMESSHVPLNKWVLAFRLMASSKKGMSAHQLHRTIAVTYKTAWFMAHRIREAMRDASPSPLGGEGKIIESDEAYWGPKDIDTDPLMKRRRRGRPGKGRKSAILSLVERHGRSRSFKMDDLRTEAVFKILREHVSTKSRLMTDEGTSHNWEFAKHERVKHGAREYARGDVSTNTVIEGNGRTARATCYYLLCAKSGSLLPGKRIVPERIRDDRDGYVAGLIAADRAWEEGNLDFTVLESYLARLLEAQLRDAD